MLQYKVRSSISPVEGIDLDLEPIAMGGDGFSTIHLGPTKKTTHILCLREKTPPPKDVGGIECPEKKTNSPYIMKSKLCLQLINK